MNESSYVRNVGPTGVTRIRKVSTIPQGKADESPQSSLEAHWYQLRILMKKDEASDDDIPNQAQNFVRNLDQNTQAALAQYAYKVWGSEILEDYLILLPPLTALSLAAEISR